MLGFKPFQAVGSRSRAAGIPVAGIKFGGFVRTAVKIDIGNIAPAIRIGYCIIPVMPGRICLSRHYTSIDFFCNIITDNIVKILYFIGFITVSKKRARPGP